MAQTKEGGNGKLEQALATLLQNQATLVQTQTAFLDQMGKLAERTADLDRVNSERFSRIERILLEHSRLLADHSRLLADHSRILEALPEAIRQKIGFKPPAKS